MTFDHQHTINVERQSKGNEYHVLETYLQNNKETNIVRNRVGGGGKRDTGDEIRQRLCGLL